MEQVSKVLLGQRKTEAILLLYQGEQLKHVLADHGIHPSEEPVDDSLLYVVKDEHPMLTAGCVVTV